MKRTFDFNSLLQVLNVIVAALVFSSMRAAETNEYIDTTSVWLGLLLSLQTQCVLVLERRRRDPFVLLLALEMIAYYSLRIFTLSLFPFSEVFNRFGFDPQDMNFALVFILIANLFLYGGLYVGGAVPGPVKAGTWRATASTSVVILMALAIVFEYFGSAYFEAGSVPRAVRFVAIFLTPHIIGLMTFAYYALFKDSCSRRFANAIAVLITLGMVLQTLFGSRSALIGFVQNLMLVAFAVYGYIAVRRKWVVLGLLSLPLFAALLVASFALSTYARSIRSGGTFDLGQSLTSASDFASSSRGEQLALDVLLPPVFARAGFLDYSAELIAHRDVYATVINPTTYAQSIVDNLLTPGFDVYDQPLIAQSLQFLYFDVGAPSKLRLLEDYQSDQLGIYGDFYTLMGYSCLPVLFLLTFGLKRLYLRLHHPNPFRLVISRVVVLFIYMQLVRSFGLDWAILQTLPLLAAAYLYAPFFSSARASRAPTPGPARLTAAQSRS